MGQFLRLCSRVAILGQAPSGMPAKVSSLVDLYSDGHVHTSFCHHAVGTMQEYVESAIAKGLQQLVFLEHLERGIHYFESTWLSDEDFVRYRHEGERLQTIFADQIKILLGVEVGFNPEALADIRYFLKENDWDRVGISYHFIEDQGRHLNMLSRKKKNLEEFGQMGVKPILTRYLDGLIAAVSEVPGNVLCHLDAGLRHHPDVCFDAGHQEQICHLLELLAQRDIALELNTSGFVHRGFPYPQSWIVRQAIAQNIRLCLGSDAHHPNDVGRFFDRIPDYLNTVCEDS